MPDAFVASASIQGIASLKPGGHLQEGVGVCRVLTAALYIAALVSSSARAETCEPLFAIRDSHHLLDSRSSSMAICTDSDGRTAKLRTSYLRYPRSERLLLPQEARDLRQRVGDIVKHFISRRPSLGRNCHHPVEFTDGRILLACVAGGPSSRAAVAFRNRQA